MSETPQVLRRRDYRPPSFLIDDTSLRVSIGGAGAPTTVAARLRVRRNGDDGERDLVLHGRELTLRRLALDGEPVEAARFAVDAEGLRVRDVPDAFTLETEVAIDPDGNSSLEGLYRTQPGYLTQCEAEGFRKITYYLDRPDVLARFTVEIDADRARCPVLLSNGNLVEQRDLGGGRHLARWHDPFPKPSYLFALVAADLRSTDDTFVTRSGRTVRLRIWTEQRNLDKCAWAMRCLKAAMKWDEDTFGLECDLDDYSVVVTDDFNMGAMENKGLNIFNSQFVLASPATATDSDYAHIEGVIGHEYFHNWTGNRVTCRDWFQLSLKEGLTVFRDQQFSAAMGSPAHKRIEDVRRLRAAQFPEDAGPMAHPVRPEEVIEINNFYTATVYEKGAEVVRMYHTLLGAEGFRRGLALYLQRHDGQAATCDDFRAAMAEAGGRDLEQFERWYRQAGTPVLDVTFEPADDACALHVRQSTPPTPGQPEKLPLHVPFAVGLLDGGGRDLPLRLRGEPQSAAATTRVLELTEAEHRFEFIGLPRPAVAPSLLRGFSAPVRVRCALSGDQLAFLLAHDGDPFQRWDAGQRLALDTLLAAMRACLAGETPDHPEVLVQALGHVLAARGNGGLDPALAAELLTLPSEALVGDSVDDLDPDAVFAAREHVRTAVARGLREQLEQTWQHLYAEEPAEYRPDAAAAGRRALRHVCLAYLMAADADGAIAARCLEQLQRAPSMTDAMSALVVLAHNDAPQRQPALDGFYDRWRDEPLVVDKWLRVQAAAPLPDTLGRVRELAAHAAFSLRNPNKVRALYGAFVANQVRFHAGDGGGYRLLREVVEQLDGINPQIASRLTSAGFVRWRRMEPGRRQHMRAELERLAARGGLSPDVYEIVSRCLDAGGE